MRFTQTRLDGCQLVEIDPHEDERGMFARVFCEQEFGDAGLPVRFVQMSLSRNLRRGTTRGMHFQKPPSREGKLVRCVRGRILDVALDLRTNSETFLEHIGVELSADDGCAIYIPPGLAHGFQTLEDHSDVIYAMTDVYAPELAAGLRWNDPKLDIDWPLSDIVINQRDAEYPDLDESRLANMEWELPHE